MLRPPRRPALGIQERKHGGHFVAPDAPSAVGGFRRPPLVAESSRENHHADQQECHQESGDPDRRSGSGCGLFGVSAALRRKSPNPATRPLPIPARCPASRAPTAPSTFQASASGTSRRCRGCTVIIATRAADLRLRRRPREPALTTTAIAAAMSPAPATGSANAARAARADVDRRPGARLDDRAPVTPMAQATGLDALHYCSLALGAAPVPGSGWAVPSPAGAGRPAKPEASFLHRLSLA